MRNRPLRPSATTVPQTSELPTTGSSQVGAWRTASGNTSTAMPAAIDRPMTSVLRASSRREAIISTPLLMMKQAVNSSTAPLTTGGMSRNSTVVTGTKAITISSAPVAAATRRLATPVATTRPPFDEPGLAPQTEPMRPPNAVVRPSASSPRPTEFMSGRTQSASLTRWASATLPIAFSAEASAVSAKGSISEASKAQPVAPQLGQASTGACARSVYSAAGRASKYQPATYPPAMPSSAAASPSTPRPQTCSPIISSSVSAPIQRCSGLIAAGLPMPKRSRTPSTASVMPTRKITSPAISGGKNGRSRGSTRATAISTRPAKTSMPASSGRPPACTASSAGPR